MIRLGELLVGEVEAAHGPPAPMGATPPPAVSRLLRPKAAGGLSFCRQDELHAALVQAGATSVSLADAEVILKEADKNKNGTIEKNELLTVLTKGTIFDGVLKR